MAARAAASPSVRLIVQAARYCDARQPPAVAMGPSAWNGASSTVTPQSSTNGRLVVSVHTGIDPSRPSFASTSAPEHWEPISWRVGSSGSASSRAGSATTSRVRMPLPTSTTSASAMNSSGRWPTTSTPFMDVTAVVGVVMYALSPAPRARLISAEAMKLSSSLNPSNVTMATCMEQNSRERVRPRQWPIRDGWPPVSAGAAQPTG
ncbi:hypothetical protein ACTXG6_20930 [Pseudonocardia sp. Cha107L01]|uniref:hypothetical protein n=1 Tax=Pseudonocardia sp. Cha107L01 TaxID=3457576 RepID=UPI00403EE841